MLALFSFWAVFFPSEPSAEPRMYFATNIALAVSLLMCVLVVTARFIRIRRRVD